MENECMYYVETDSACLLTGRCCVTAVNNDGNPHYRGYFDGRAKQCPAYNIGENHEKKYLAEKIQEANLERDSSALVSKLKEGK